MKKVITFSIVFSVLILFSTSTFAQHFGWGMRDQGLRRLNSTRILRVLKANQEELNVTDSQLKKIEELIFGLEKKMISLQSRSGEMSLELRKIMMDEKDPDYEKIKAALSKQANIRHDVFIERLKTRKEIEKILTPEQQEAIKSMRKDLNRGRRTFHREGRQERFPGFRSRIRK